MRKVFFPFLLCLFSFMWAEAFSATWGLVSDYYEPVKEGKKSAVGEKYLMRQILRGKPVVVKLMLKEEDEKKRNSVQKLIEDSYKEWFSYTAKLIRNQKRQTEFSDVLPILDRGIKVQFSAQERDIDFSVMSRKEVLAACDGLGAGCYFFGQKNNNFIPHIYIPKDSFPLNLLFGSSEFTEEAALHEIGHSLGLSDQYAFARDNNTHAVYHSSKPAESIMETNSSLTCDDADGIVNLIDITLGTSRGGDTGWRSFCKDSSDYYSHGKVLAASPYHIEYDAEIGKWILTSMQKGSLAVQNSFEMDLQTGIDPLSALQEKVLKKDASGRPVWARASTGENVYYSYIYDKKTRLVVRGGKVVLAEVWSLAWKNKKWRHFPGQQYEAYFGGDGKYRSMLATFYPKRGGELNYGEGESLLFPERVVSMLFDEKRALEYEEWMGFGMENRFSNSDESFANLEAQIQAEQQERYIDDLRADLLKWFEKKVK